MKAPFLIKQHTQTVYEASDGSRWNTRLSAVEHERKLLLAEVLFEECCFNRDTSSNIAHILLNNRDKVIPLLVEEPAVAS